MVLIRKASVSGGAQNASVGSVYDETTETECNHDPPLKRRSNGDAPSTQQLSQLLKVLEDRHEQAQQKNGGPKTSQEGKNGTLLQGRRVMIPVTSKAFVEGTLQPHRIARGETQKEPSHTEEAVLMNAHNSDVLLEMTRTEATQFLLQRIRAQNTPATATSPKTKKVSKSKPSAKCLPCMDIQEVYDESGTRLVRSEVVDVSQNLRLFQKNFGADEEDDPQEKDTTDVEEDEDKDKDDNEHGHDNQLSEKTKSVLSDEAYAALSSRLDELAILEEEEANRADDRLWNELSSKALEGKAWKRGFLDSPTTKPPKPTHRSTATTTNRKKIPNLATSTRTLKAAAAPDSPSAPPEPLPTTTLATNQNTDHEQLNKKPKQPTPPTDTASRTPSSRPSETTATTKPRSTSGWAKGFLNNKTTTSKKKKATKPTTQGKAAGVESKTESPQEGSGSEELKEALPPTVEEETTRKKISFKEQDDVREIPRENRGLPLPPKKSVFGKSLPFGSFPNVHGATTMGSTKGAVPDQEDKVEQPLKTPTNIESGRSSSHREPIPSAVFSGIVQERGHSTTTATGRSSDPAATASSGPSSGPAPPPKRMSRFAQERMGLRN